MVGHYVSRRPWIEHQQTIDLTNYESINSIQLVVAGVSYPGWCEEGWDEAGPFYGWLHFFFREPIEYYEQQVQSYPVHLNYEGPIAESMDEFYTYAWDIGYIAFTDFDLFTIRQYEVKIYLSPSTTWDVCSYPEMDLTSAVLIVNGTIAVSNETSDLGKVKTLYR